MNDRVKRVITLLDSFEPSEDDTETVVRLYDLLDGFRALPNRAAAIPAMLQLIERHRDAELGSPGPLVHELESLPGYEPLLRESLRRRPASLSLWMANRLANATDGAEREGWLAELRAILEHPEATPALKDEARDFLAYQVGRGSD